jgi:hypothetical protein
MWGRLAPAPGVAALEGGAAAAGRRRSPKAPGLAGARHREPSRRAAATGMTADRFPDVSAGLLVALTRRRVDPVCSTSAGARRYARLMLSPRKRSSIL